MAAAFEPVSDKDPNDPGYPSLPEAARLAEAGATLGFGDEINAAARTAFGPGSYTENVADERAKLAAARTRRFSSFAELAGGAIPALASMGIGGAAKVAPGVARQVISGVKTGLGFGAAAGAGNANPDPESPLLDQAKTMAMGAGVGGVVGAGLGGAAPAAVGTVGWLAGRAKDFLTGRGAVGPIQRKILRDINNAGINVADEAATLPLANPAAGRVLGDIGGEGALGPLAQGAAGIPGSSARPTLQHHMATRSLRRADRLATDLDNALGLSPVQMPQYADEILSSAETRLNGLYRAAEQESPFIRLTPETAALLKDPQVKAMVEELIPANSLVEAMGGVSVGPSPYSPKGHLWMPKGISPVLLDRMITRAGEIGDGMLATPGTNRRAGAAFLKLKDRLLEDLQVQAPKFGKARLEYRLTQERARAAQLGAEVAKGGHTAAEIEDLVAGLNPDHIPDFQAGAAAVQRGKIVDARSGELTNPRLAEGIDSRMAATYGTGPAERFRAAANQEAQLLPLERSLQGSRTAGMSASMDDLQSGVADFLGRSAMVIGSGGSALGAGVNIGKGLMSYPLKALAKGMTAGRADLMAEELLRGKAGPEALKAAYAEYAKMQKTQGMMAAAGSALGRALAMVGGGRMAAP